MQPIYDGNQITEAWQAYNEKMVLLVLKDGKKIVKPLAGSVEGCTSARTVKIKSVMGFPKFLEREYA